MSVETAATTSATGTAMARDRFSLNQWTIREADLATAVAACLAADVPAIGLWREKIAEAGGAAAARRIVDDAGLRVSSLCRSGFFTTPDPDARRAAIDENRRAIDEAATVGAPTLVLVAGGLPDGSKDLVGARLRVQDAIAELAPHATDAGVTLAIEPLHPMYVADRAVVSTLGQALELSEPFAPSAVGVVVDTFHVFWDPQVLELIDRAGRAGRIASYQVCDWMTPLPADVLLARDVPGDGHIDFGPMTRAVAASGYTGDVEVEIFNRAVWDSDPHATTALLRRRFDELVAPDLA